MDVAYEVCAGIDVHKNNGVACRIYKAQDGKIRTEKQTFPTMTKGLFALSDWLSEVESANIKRGAVASDLLGVSSRRILRRLISEETPDLEALADLAIGKLRDKHGDLVLALQGCMNAHHRFMLGHLLDPVEELDVRIGAFEARIEEMSLPFKQAVELVDTIPAASQTAAMGLAVVPNAEAAN